VRCPDGSDYLCWKNLFEFTVSADGRSVVCGPLDQSTNESLETYLLGPVLSFALAKQGREPLHATAVIVDGKAIAFLGARKVNPGRRVRTGRLPAPDRRPSARR
jgi:hypothetical protein